MIDAKRLRVRRYIKLYENGEISRVQLAHMCGMNHRTLGSRLEGRDKRKKYTLEEALMEPVKHYHASSTPRMHSLQDPLANSAPKHLPQDMKFAHETCMRMTPNLNYKMGFRG